MAWVGGWYGPRAGDLDIRGLGDNAMMFWLGLGVGLGIGLIILVVLFLMYFPRGWML